MSAVQDLDLYSSGQTAARLGVSSQWVRELARRGEITAFKTKSGEYFLTGHEIEQAIQQRRQARSEGE